MTGWKVFMTPEGLLFWFPFKEVFPFPGKYATLKCNQDSLRIRFFPEVPEENPYYEIKKIADGYLIGGLQKVWRCQGVDLWKLQKLRENSPQKTELKWDYQCEKEGQTLILLIPPSLKSAISRF